MSVQGMKAPPDGMEVYKAIFDTWRSQVDSSWQRSNYFAAFEIAAIGGCWLLVSGEKRLPVGVGILFSAGGLWLTWIWYRSTKKTQAYVRHWWDSLMKVEDWLALSPYDFARQLERKGGEEYRRLLKQIPLLFGVAWIVLLIVATSRFACFMGTAAGGAWTFSSVL
jgi:hypothetical protein